MINGLDLFSGCGMVALGLSGYIKPLAYCEIEQFAQAVLLSRMQDGEIPFAPIWDDVCSLPIGELAGSVQIITAGFPCTDISTAGRGAGLEGSRSGLFFEVIRCARALRPRFIFLENVPAITVRGLDRVLLELAALGYDCRWTIVSAAEMGAPHIRERWFLLAHSNRESSGDKWKAMGRTGKGVGKWKAEPQYESVRMASDPVREGRQRWIDTQPWFKEFAIGGGGGIWPSWLPQPAIRRGDDGYAHRLDALKCLGNGVPPQVYLEAFERLGGLS